MARRIVVKKKKSTSASEVHSQERCCICPLNPPFGSSVVGRGMVVMSAMEMGLVIGWIVKVLLQSCNGCGMLTT